MSVVLWHGDARDKLRLMSARGDKVHSCVTDPPYHIESIAKRFGKKTSARAKHGRDGAFARQSAGFHGRNWDAADPDGVLIAQDPEFWQLVFDVLYPGAYVVAFAGARSYHRMANAIEAAGFVTHPMIGWLYGSGMPKAHSAQKALHRLGVESASWSGWYYGTQARKPALEPIFVGQKPFSEASGARNISVHGVGAVNIDNNRAPGGRWPANLMHDGSDMVDAVLPRNTKEFFESFPFEATPAIYCPKPNKKEKGDSGHPTVKPLDLMRALVRHVTPPGGIVLDPFAGTGTTGVAASAEKLRAVLIEQEVEYISPARQRLGLAPLPIGWDSPYAEFLGVEACRYCGNSGWFYGEVEFGPCECKAYSLP